MKRYIYLLCLSVSLIGLSSCSKNNDPAPVSPVVGRWELNRGLLTGFVAPYTDLNNVGLDLYNYDFGSQSSRIDIRSDNSFTNNIKSDGEVVDANGTWEYTNTQLTLRYDNGQQGTYTYSSSRGIEELTSTATKINFPVSSTSTAPGNLQSVYRK